MRSSLSVLSFSGEHRWLSNFWLAPIKFTAFGSHFTVPTTEHLFQMSKLEHIDASNFKKKYLFEEVVSLDSPGKAKRFGKMISDLNMKSWNEAKDEAMKRVLQAKYTQHPDLMEKLLGLEGCYIEEGNTWGDRYWGVDNGAGLNRLGNIYMELRDSWLAEKGGFTNANWQPELYVPTYFS